MKMNPVVHFELPAEDQKRMIEFYARVFGWKAEMLGPTMGDYTLIATAERGPDGMVKEPGRINGGIFTKTSKSAQHPSLVIAVEDIQKSRQGVKEAGGTIVDGPTDIPGFGIYASFTDSEGNRMSMMQPTMI